MTLTFKALYSPSDLKVNVESMMYGATVFLVLSQWSVWDLREDEEDIKLTDKSTFSDEIIK